MQYRVRHETRYEYSEDVSLSHTLVTCQPRTTDWQRCLGNEVSIEPNPALWDKRRDAWGNWVGYFSLEERHQHLTITCRSLVEVDARAYPKRSHQVLSPIPEERPDLYRYLYPSFLTRIESENQLDYARASFLPGRSAWDSTLDLMHRIHRDFRYLPGATAVSTPLTQVMQQRQGVCQDFAHVMLACLRSQGIACRYVSGYLLTTPPPGQPRLIGADASHAWVSAWLPGEEQGMWVDLDPTNDCLCQQQHIVLAWGRDYQDVAPVRGVVLGGGQQRIRVSVDVNPADTEPA